MLANIAMTYLSKELNTEIKIDRLEIKSLKSVALTNLLIKDINKDTVVSSGYFLVRLNRVSPKKKLLDIAKLEMNEADIRIKVYKNTNQSNIRFLIDYFVGEPSIDTLSVEPKDTTKAEEGWKIQFRKFKIAKSKFIFDNQNEEHLKSKVIDFNDIQIRNLDLEAENAMINNNVFKADIQQISVFEKSGFFVDSLSCNFEIGPQILSAQDLKLVTPGNDLDLDLKFSFDSFKDFNDFIDKINIDATLRPSIMNLYDVGFFAPVLFRMNNRIKIAGDIKGTVDDFKAKDLKFAFGGNTQFRGNVQMSGLPEITETFTHLSINDFTTSSYDIKNFELPIESNHLKLPDVMDNLGEVNIKGKFTGFYNDFVSYGNFTSRMGKVKTDLLLRVNSKNDVEYKGKIQASDFNAGKLFSAENILGKMDLSANISGSGFEFEGMKIKMDGVLDNFEFKGNIYNEIKLDGELDNQKFIGNVKVSDDNINFDFNGSIDYGSIIPQYNFVADIRDAKLHNINLVDRDPSSTLSTKLNINFMGDHLDNIQGIIIIDSTDYQEKDQRYFMKDFTLSITRDASKYAFVSLYSDIIDATIEGDFILKDLPKSIQGLFNQYLDTLFTDVDSISTEPANQDFIFSIMLKNTTGLSQLFIPELSVAERTEITGGFNSRIENIFVEGKSSEIQYQGLKLLDWNVDFFARNNELYLQTGGRELFLSDTLNINSLNLICRASEDTVRFDSDWKNNEHKLKNFGDIQGYLALMGKNRMELRLDQGKVMIADTLWKISKSNAILFDTNFVQFHEVAFQSYRQGIEVDGRISKQPLDTLSIGFTEFSLSNSDLILKEFGIDLDGKINGYLKLTDYYGSPTFLSDIHISDLYMNKEKLGDADIVSTWDPQLEAFNILGEIIYTGNIGKSTTLEAKGTYFPRKEDNNYDIGFKLNNYKLTTLEPFISSFSSLIKGLATGEFRLTGSKDKPILTGDLSLMRTQLKIDYLNVSYFFADQIHLKENLIWFDNLVVYDSLNNQAVCSGKIFHNHLKDFNIDLTLDANKLAGLNTSREQNSTFYGKAFVSGKVRIYGPFDNLTMDIDIKSEKGTNLKIPPSYSSDIAENDFIIFVNEEQDTTTNDKYDVNIQGLTLNLGLDVNQDANLQIFLPYQMGNLQASGNGNIIMKITPSGNFTIDGDYVIYKGSFFLTLQNIISRNFDIKRGSTVSWTGDPYDAQINMKAVYKIRTALGDYGPTEDSATRVPVDCIITLSNKLLDPEIRFSIEFPNLDDDTKQTVYSRLDTNDQAMMSQQMISLLVLNSFYNPSGATGSVGFNTFSLVTNQLNNWLSKISNDFDIGINYRQGDQLSTSEVEVALTTQLFDNRVSIDGNVGVRGTENTENANSLVGEVTVEVKITPDGRFRAKAFNKSNNNYLYKNYSPYTQGVGVFYTREFNQFKDIFRRNSSSRLTRPSEDQTMVD
ncbi:MAG: translocation/assembly module TamB [Bacteroidales bacterium]|nr:translocation/assembly module TamB [Bacteroidales bacterium]